MSLFADGQIILATGASSGIGLACALEANSQGAVVIANGRNEEKLRDAKRSCHRPDQWHNEPYDLCQGIDGISAWVDSLRKKYGRLHGLAHCAGVGRIDSVAGIDLEDARRHFDMNFFVPLMLARAFSDRRNCAKNASMVFIASIAGVQPEKGNVLYGAAKAALIAAVKAASQELAGRGIRANSISPGLVETPMAAQALQTMGPEFLQREKARYPLGLGRPADVAHMACFLLSDKATWITGQNFILAGGAY